MRLASVQHCAFCHGLKTKVELTGREPGRNKKIFDFINGLRINSGLHKPLCGGEPGLVKTPRTNKAGTGPAYGLI